MPTTIESKLQEHGLTKEEAKKFEDAAARAVKESPGHRLNPVLQLRADFVNKNYVAAFPLQGDDPRPGVYVVVSSTTPEGLEAGLREYLKRK
jgi:hypothetical protein